MNFKTQKIKTYFNPNYIVDYLFSFKFLLLKFEFNKNDIISYIFVKKNIKNEKFFMA